MTETAISRRVWNPRRLLERLEADEAEIAGGGGGEGVRPLTASYALDARSGSYTWQQYTDDIGLQASDKLGHLTLAPPGVYWAHIRLVSVAGLLPTPLIDCLYWLRMNTDLGEAVGGEGVFVPGGSQPAVSPLMPTPPAKMLKSDGSLSLAAPQVAYDFVPLSNHAVIDGWSDGITVNTSLSGLYSFDITYFG